MRVTTAPPELASLVRALFRHSKHHDRAALRAIRRCWIRRGVVGTRSFTLLADLGSEWLRDAPAGSRGQQRFAKLTGVISTLSTNAKQPDSGPLNDAVLLLITFGRTSCLV